MATQIITQLLGHPGGWGPPHGGPGWIIGLFFLLLLAGLITAVVWLAVRGSRQRDRSGAQRAKDVLADRYARGEISTEEYRERLDQLG
ncbi:SHOCT domain-containing protein [Saccharopolyspora erythraea]|uniref:SHOCT domain-containing protein n=1 Tax=Saccharopolyspora erythraea TaxID=1836 RepID=UPI002010DE07|nr:SHOCT domain-containing protein [Saccharopolyspora erythraea]